MKRVLSLSLVLGVGFAAGQMLDWVPRTAAAVNGQGGGVEKCAPQNGDTNADGKVDMSDAVTILGYLFLGNPTGLMPLCDRPELLQKIAELEAENAAKSVALDSCRAELEATKQALDETKAQLAQCQADLTQCRAHSGLPDTAQTNPSTSCPGQDAFFATGCPAEGRFVDNGDGTVTDNCTNLMWQKDTSDVNGDGVVVNNFSDVLPWCDALSYCDGLSFAGHDDWRLPNVRELQSIVDYGRTRPAIDPVFSALSTFYWSSTYSAADTGAGNPVAAMDVSFYDDVGTYSGNSAYGYYVRAVRSVP